MVLSRLRHQLPVLSPLPLGRVLGAVRDAAGGARDPRPRLAERLRARFAADSVVLCGSGSQALQLAIGEARRRLGGDPTVALPAFTCYDVATAAVGAGARLALYDLDPDTLGPDLDDLDRVLAAGARVVVASPLYGVPLDWDRLESLVERHGAILVEDAAQGHGASWRGRPLGSLGRISVLSFGRGKGWTGGGGGALLLRGPLADEPPLPPDPSRAAEAAALASVLAQWSLGRPAVYGIPASIPALGLGRTVYREPRAPSAIARIAAAILLATEEDAREEAERRRVRGAALQAELDGAPGVRPVGILSAGTPGWLRLPIRAARGLGAFADPAAARRLGAAPGYPSPLGALEAVRRRLAGPARPAAGAEELARDLVTLPTHGRVAAAERRALIRFLSPPARAGRGARHPAPTS